MLPWLSTHEPTADALAAIQRITLRASLAAIVSFLMALALGPALIAWLRHRFREPIKSASPTIEQLHEHKRSTPTMGGIFIVAGIVASGLVLGNLSNPYLQVGLITAVGLAAVGAVDDWTKLTTNTRGLSARTKLLGQCVVAGTAALLLYRADMNIPGGLDLTVPGVRPIFSLGWLFVPLAVFVIVAASNAVNLTDGLDGLAGGCLIFATAAMALVAYASGHREWSDYLGIIHVAGAGELTVLAGGMIGGVLGFLWFNCHPASVFMGNTGALPLGGLLGLLAVAARQELLLAIIGGVFVVEALSVLVQITSFKLRGRRVFLCAPLHHHFQFRGWPEGKIVVRFWIAGALCAILGLASLKLSARDRTDAPDALVGQAKPSSVHK